MGVKLISGAMRQKTYGQKVHILPLFLAVFVVMLAFTAGNAWSFEAVKIENKTDSNLAFRNSYQSSTLSNADSCRPLLKSIRQNSGTSAMDRNRHHAGKAAALGLVLGIRMALPSAKSMKSGKKLQSSLGLWQPAPSFAGDTNALAIADYRRCRKNQALNSSLQAIHDFRWSR